MKVGGDFTKVDFLSPAWKNNEQTETRVHSKAQTGGWELRGRHPRVQGSVLDELGPRTLTCRNLDGGHSSGPKSEHRTFCSHFWALNFRDIPAIFPDIQPKAYFSWV